MTNQLEVKQVPFMGTDLMAARDADGQIWAGVRWMCDGMGLSRNQRDGQIQKIKADRVLSKGAENLPLPTNGGEQSVLCLKLDFVPLWLAKISITPTIEAETPELASNLEQYQLRAKDVLAAAFLPKQADATRTYRMPLSSANNTAKIMYQAMGEAGVDPRYKVLALQDLYQSVGLKLNIPGLRAPTRYYTAEAIADKLGVLSKAGKPHAQAVGAIIKKIAVTEDEKIRVPFERNGHSDTSIQYAEQVVEKIRNWLSANGYPAAIQGADGTSYKVSYQTVPRTVNA